MKEYNLDYFSRTGWSFIFLKKDKIVYRSKGRGLQPLLFCLKNKREDLKGATVYDKVVGRAAALLLVHGKVKKIMTPSITGDALARLKEKNIQVDFGFLAKIILNAKGNGPCPMEILSKGKNAGELFRILTGK
ncbi:MAG: DUF1893 domain-containing protein [Patescibacteria group bacterium]|jgi:hypothetical protein